MVGKEWKTSGIQQSGISVPVLTPVFARILPAAPERKKYLSVSRESGLLRFWDSLEHLLSSAYHCLCPPEFSGGKGDGALQKKKQNTKGRGNGGKKQHGRKSNPDSEPVLQFRSAPVL